MRYLGIGAEFKGLFKDMMVAQAVDELKQVDGGDYEDLIAILSGR